MSIGSQNDPTPHEHVVQGPHIVLGMIITCTHPFVHACHKELLYHLNYLALCTTCGRILWVSI
jgi:hypothetical protein